MIFYTIKHHGATVDWAGTQADARQGVKTRAEAAGAMAGEVTWQEEDVPTDKPKLLAWLKANVTGERRVKQAAELPHPTTTPQTQTQQTPSSQPGD